MHVDDFSGFLPSSEFIRDSWFQSVPTLSSYTLLEYENAPKAYVYFIRCGDFIKIGCSATPEERVNQLRRGGKATRPSVWEGNPYLIGYLPGSRKDESAQHRSWSHLRDRGEWFRTDEDLVIHAEEVRLKQAKLEVEIHEERRRLYCLEKNIDYTQVDLDTVLHQHLNEQVTA